MYVTELSRISRSTKDLLEFVDRLTTEGVFLKSLTQTWLDTSDSNPTSKLMLGIFASLSEFEREQMVSRKKLGLESARAQGRIGGRPKTETVKLETVFAELNKFGNLKSIAQICKENKISRTTFYKYAKKVEKIKVLKEIDLTKLEKKL